MDERRRSRCARRMRQGIDEAVAGEAAVADAEQRILLSGVSWRTYESLLKLPDLDFARLIPYLERSDKTAAVRQFRDGLCPPRG